MVEKIKPEFKKTLLIVELVVILGIVVLLATDSFYTVNEQQQAVITQFGKVVGTNGAGLHFKAPLFQDVILVNMTTNGMEFGYVNKDNTTYSVDSESFMITNDFNFVSVDFYVEWKVSDPARFLFASEDPEGLLRNILQSEARSVVSSYNVDDVLTTAKGEIQAKVREGVSAKLDEYNLGLLVSNISIQDTEPPTAEVISAFKNVENAKQRKDTEINVANTYANEVIPQARAEADRIVKEAEAVKEARKNEAEGQVARFNEMYREYARNKDITRTRIYLETMEQVLPNVRVIIDTGDSSLHKIVNIDSTVPASNNNLMGGVVNE